MTSNNNPSRTLGSFFTALEGLIGKHFTDNDSEQIFKRCQAVVVKYSKESNIPVPDLNEFDKLLISIDSEAVETKSSDKNESGNKTTKTEKAEAFKQGKMLVDSLFHLKFKESSEILYNSIDLINKYQFLELRQQIRYNQTILHLICLRGQLALLKFILSKVSSDTVKRLLSLKDQLNQTCFDIATPECRECIIFYLNNQSIESLEKISEQCKSIYRQRSVNDALYNTIIKSKNTTFLNSLIDLHTIILKEYLPFSDDLFLLCIKYCRDSDNSGGNVMNKSKIAKKKQAFIELCENTIKTCVNVSNSNGKCEKAKKMKTFYQFYFKQFIMTSNYWYLETVNDSKDEKSNESKENSKEEDKTLTFDNLSVAVNKELEISRNFIKKSIDNIVKTEPEQWQKLTSYKCSPHIDPTKLLKQPRQDGILNGLKANYKEDTFDKASLLSQNQHTKNYNFKHLYSINSYLSLLLTRAHLLNDEFQQSMIKLVDVFNQNNLKSGVKYSDGPVKLRQRCLVKIESDYSNERFPAAAHLSDIMRCSFTFSNVKDLLIAMDVFEKLHCNDIVRIKNGFFDFDNKKEYRYQDVKYNVIISSKNGNIAIIGEIQFIIDVMDKAKHMGHFLYSILRRNDFIHFIDNVYKLQFNAINKYDIFNFAISKRDIDTFGLALMNLTQNAQSTDEIISVRDGAEYKTILHSICENHWYKAYQLYNVLVLNESAREKIVDRNSSKSNKNSKNTKNNKNSGKITSKKEFLKEIWQQRDKLGYTPLMTLGLQTHENSNSVKNEIDSLFSAIVKQYKDVINLGDAGNQFNWSLLSIYCNRGHRDCIKLMLDMCLENGDQDFKMDINFVSNAGQTCVAEALVERHLDVIKLLLDPKYHQFNKNFNVNQKAQKNMTLLDYCKVHNVDQYAQVFEKFS